MARCFLVLFCFSFFWVSQVYSFGKTETDTAIVLDSASLFLDFGKCIHAIAFDGNGKLFLAGCQDIYSVMPDKTITHLATLTDTSAKTTIWGMTFNKNGDLYLAAHDRIIRIKPGCKPETIINENFTGPCGVTDLRFDDKENLYAVYDNVVAVYNKSLEKNILINGKELTPPIQWAVGIELDDKCETLFICDCNGKSLYSVPIKKDDFIKLAKTTPTNWGQYLTKNNNGEIFVAMHGPKIFPEFLVQYKNSITKNLYCKKRPHQAKDIYKKAIAIGKEGFDTNAIYCIIGDKIYLYKL